MEKSTGNALLGVSITLSLLGFSMVSTTTGLKGSSLALGIIIGITILGVCAWCIPHIKYKDVYTVKDSTRIPKRFAKALKLTLEKGAPKPIPSQVDIQSASLRNSPVNVLLQLHNDDSAKVPKRFRKMTNKDVLALSTCVPGALPNHILACYTSYAARYMGNSSDSYTTADLAALKQAFKHPNIQFELAYKTTSTAWKKGDVALREILLHAENEYVATLARIYSIRESANSTPSRRALARIVESSLDVKENFYVFLKDQEKIHLEEDDFDEILNTAQSV